MMRDACLLAVLGAASAVIAGGDGGGANCEQTSVGLAPINDLGAGLHLGQFQGGLYPGGANVPPGGHAAVGAARAASIEPMDSSGFPDP